MKPSLKARVERRLFGGEAGGVFRGMAVLATGSAMAKLVGIAAIPILTRLYTPEDFGLMAVFTALVLMITPILTLRYVLAIPLPRRDGTAMNLLALSLLLLMGFGLVMSLLLWAFGGPLLRLIGMEELASWWWLIVLGGLGGAIYELLSYWATRRRAYKVIARTSVTQQLWGNLVKLALGALSFGAAGLLIGQVVSKSGGSLTLIRSFQAELRQSWKQVRFYRMRQMVGRYATFPVYRLPSQLLLVLSMQAPIILVARLFSAGETGQLALAMSAVAIPVTLISTSTAKAFYAEAAEAFRANRDLRSLAVSVAKRSAGISLLPSVGIAALSVPVFPVAFGPDWGLAGLLTALLGLAIAPQFVSQVILKALPIVGRNDLFFYFNLSRAVLTIAAILIPGALGYGIVTCVASYVLVLSLQRVGQVFWALRVLAAAQKSGVV